MLKYEDALQKMADMLESRYNDNYMGGSMNPWDGVQTSDIAFTLAVAYDMRLSVVERQLSGLLNFYIQKRNKS